MPPGGLHPYTKDVTVVVGEDGLSSPSLFTSHWDPGSRSTPGTSEDPEVEVEGLGFLGIQEDERYRAVTPKYLLSLRTPT